MKRKLSDLEDFSKRKKKKTNFEAIKVAIRIRPKLESEKTKEHSQQLSGEAFEFNIDNGLTLKLPKNEITYKPDFCFHATNDTKQIYSDCCQGMVNQFLEGYNSIILYPFFFFH